MIIIIIVCNKHIFLHEKKNAILSFEIKFYACFMKMHKSNPI